MIKKHVLRTGYMVICLMMITIDVNATANLSPIDRYELTDQEDHLVFVAFHHAPNAGERLLKEFSINGYAFHFIDTIMTKLKASKVLALADHDLILDVEIVDESMAIILRDLLTQLFRVSLYDDIQAFDLSVLNISIGPPKHLLRKGRTADRTIRRAYKRIVKDHGIPVVTSAGNDGPVLGPLKVKNYFFVSLVSATLSMALTMNRSLKPETNANARTPAP